MSNKEIKCEKCCKIFKYSYLLNRHINKKNQCDDINKIIKILHEKKLNIDKQLTQNKYDISKYNDKIENLTLESLESKNICKFCNKNFTRKYNLEKHITLSCNYKKILLDEKNKLELEQQNILIYIYTC